MGTYELYHNLTHFDVDTLIYYIIYYILCIFFSPVYNLINFVYLILLYNCVNRRINII